MIASVGMALTACVAPLPQARTTSSTPDRVPIAEAPVVDVPPVEHADPKTPEESAPAPANASANANVSEGTILIIGDSHALGPFGWRLANRLTGSARLVVTEGACGATTETFWKVPQVACGYAVVERTRDGAMRAVVNETGPAKADTLDTMMTKFSPSVVVVVLGTNYPRAPVAEGADEFMKRLCRDGSCPRVFWIGPPSFGGLASGYISKSIKSALERWDGATFIDSTAFNEKTPLPLRTPHFRDGQARQWADYAFDRISPALH